MAVCEGEQTGKEAVDPLLRQLCRKRERQECRDRPATHGGNVAQPASQTAMSDTLRRLPVAPEVDSFQAEVCGNKRVLSRGKTEQSAVIPDTKKNRGASAIRFLSQSGNQLAFRNRHLSKLQPNHMRVAITKKRFISIVALLGQDSFPCLTGRGHSP